MAQARVCIACIACVEDVPECQTAIPLQKQAYRKDGLGRHAVESTDSHPRGERVVSARAIIGWQS
jgi:hypothetical protein